MWVGLGGCGEGWRARHGLLVVGWDGEGDQREREEKEREGEEGRVREKGEEVT